MGHKDDKIKKLEKRIRELEKARGTELSTKQKDRFDSNSWDHIADLGPVIVAAIKDENWIWVKNWDCKYINLRVDMRDGGAIIVNRAGKRISPDQLTYQYNYLEENEDGKVNS